MRMLALLTILTTAACGDNTQPVSPPDAAPSPDAHVFTWGDAETVYADGWCTYAERCYPSEFAQHFGDHALCVTAVAAQNCASALRADPCTDPYPTDRTAVLATCHADMAGIECSATSAPDSCYAAFAPGGGS